MAVDYTDLGIDPESGLTLKQHAFCQHYLTHLCLTKAYREAGYSSATYEQARADAKHLKDQPNVDSYIRQKMDERADRLRVSADRVLLELAICCYSNLTDYVVNPDTGVLSVRPGVPAEALRAVSSLKLSRKSTTRTITTGRGDNQRVEVINEVLWSGEWKLYPKADMARLLCMHLGLVTADLPPLEVLLNRLPPPVASILRQLLAAPPGGRPQSVLDTPAKPETA